MALNGTFYGTTPNAYITPKIVWSATQSTTGNYSTVTATLYYSRTNSGYETSGIGTFGITINGTTKSETKNIKITYNSNTVAVTNSVKVPHNADGTKTITISGSGVITGTTLSSTTISANVTLDTIPRKSSLTASNGTLGTAQTLTISRASSGFTHSIRYKCGSVDTAIITKTGKTSISFTPPLTLAAQNTTGTTVSITFTLYTFSGDTQIGTTTKTISCSIPASVKPTCELTVSDAAGYVSTFFAYVQGQSQLAISVAAEEAHSSPITGYTVTADGKTYSAASVTTPVLSGSGELTVSATVKDKRGRSGTASMQIPVLAYTAPRITSLNVHRCDDNGVENDQGEYVKATFSSAVERLVGRNTASYTLAYKKTADTSYTTIELTDYSNNYAVSGASYIFEADSGSSYDVQISVSDYFQTETRSTTASTARTLVHWNAAGDGIAFGKLSEKSDAFECAFEMFDRFGTEIGNGLAAYTGSGDDGIDPDTTLEPLILTNHANAPRGSGTFFYISTTFYNTKAETAARSQLAHPYKTAGELYFRYYASGAWSAWERIAGNCTRVTTEGTDLNDYMSDGWYFFTSTYTPVNIPGGTNGFLHVLDGRGDKSFVKQFFYRSGTPGTNDYMAWHRTYTSAVGWGKWWRFAVEDDLPTTGAFSFKGSYVDMYPTATDATNDTNYRGWFGYGSSTSLELTLHNSSEGNLTISTAGDGIRFGVNGTFCTAMFEDRFRALTNDQQYLGDSSRKWKAVYAVNGTIQTSDRNLKENIRELDQRYIDLFDRLLPVSFEFNDSESDRVHIGFISQDVNAAMDEVGLSDLDFAGFCRDVLTKYNEETEMDEPVLDENGEPVYIYSLRYTEFVALNSKMIQLNRQRLTEQQTEIDALKAELDDIKNLIAGKV